MLLHPFIDDSRIVFDYEFVQSLGFVAPLSWIFEDIGAKEVIIIIIIIIFCITYFDFCVSLNICHQHVLAA